MLGRIAPLVTVAACVAALAGGAEPARAAQLRAVSSRVDGGVNSIVIEAPSSPAADRAGGLDAGRAARHARAPGRRCRARPVSRFTGHPVSLDFQGADLRAVLRTFAEISGLNVVIDPTITGSVDVSLRDVPWDQALDIILKANKLGYYVDGSIVRIAPLGVLADEEAQRRKLADEQALAGELRVFTRPLSYAKAADLGPDPHPQRAVGARRGPGRSAHQHRHHPRPARSSDRGGRADGGARPAAAAGGDRGAHRPDHRATSPAAWASSGASTAGCRRSWATPRRWPSRTTAASPAAPAPSRGPTAYAHRRQPGRRQRHQRARPGARLDQRRASTSTSP